jgi:Nif-specific regulatory protein/two-component system response regulator HydG
LNHEHSQAELQALLDLAAELLRLEDKDAILDTVVRRSLEILHGERGFLVLQRGQDQSLKVVRGWSREELEGVGEPISRSIVADVRRRKEPVLVEDALGDERFAELDSVLRQGIRSVLAAPLHVEGALEGVLYLESRSIAHLFGERQLDLFLRILDLSSRVLEICLRQLLLEERNALLEGNFLERHRFPGILTNDPAFLKILETVAQVAPSDLPVLVQGPTGTGKELIVRALHVNSQRSRRRLSTVNCGAVSPTLLESELFGHVRGAFTGAHQDKEGIIPAADGGSVFLDEIGEMPKELQVKILRTLQFGEVQPVGSVRPRTVDVRFFAATNRDLEEEVRAGRFREDLLYRLNAITLELPPLKERPADILPLFHHFVEREAERGGRSVPRITGRLEAALAEHTWPGNVRDLENEARRLVALTPEGMPLTVDNLSRRIRTALPEEPGALPTLEQAERRLVQQHLEEAGGNRSQAARTLGVSREGLRKKMLRLGIE